MSAIPAVGRPRPMRLPSVGEEKLGNGLRVIAARRPGVPRFELRLRIPLARRGQAANPARQAVLADTLLAGTNRLSSVDIAEQAQRLGGSLAASQDVEWLVVSGSALSTNLAPFLELLGEVVAGASFPAGEVAVGRERLAQETLLALSQPEQIARDALSRRLYPRHPYGWGTPKPEAIGRVSATAVRQLHKERVLPAGSVLVVVGDVTADRTLATAQEVLGRWRGRVAGPHRLSAPPQPRPGGITLVSRPGAVQSNIRLGGPAVPRLHPDFPALVLTNAVYGGYFTSRLVDNIRERRGYTYSPGSGIEHRQAASTFAVTADVGTEVTVAALVEIRYELGRMVAADVGQDELDAARRYLQGTLAMSVQTQAGLSAYLAMLATSGLGVDFLRAYPAMLEKVTVTDVRDAAEAYLAPARLATVVVGDPKAIGPGLEALDEVSQPS